MFLRIFANVTLLCAGKTLDIWRTEQNFAEHRDIAP